MKLDISVFIQQKHFHDFKLHCCFYIFPSKGIHIAVSVFLPARPYFIEEPKDIEIGVGANVEFTCNAGGEPTPDIDWFINGVPLKGTCLW